MLTTHPPYALAATTFRFAALAALAGRAPLGGQREVALATYLAARLAHDSLPTRGIVDSIRAERAASAKSWLSTLSLPSAVRPMLARLLDASAGDGMSTPGAVRAVLTAASGFLDGGSRAELDRLAALLECR